MNGARRGCTLALDASTGTGSVAVGAAGRVLAEASISVGAGHSSALLPAIDYVVTAAGAARSEIESVVVGAGPGSFTGVRIAAATAKGIAGALGLPLLAYSSLLAVAAGAAPAGGEILVLFDARGRDVYAACYRFGEEVLTVLEPRASTIDEVIEDLRGREISAITGDGVVRHRDELEKAFGVEVAPAHLHHPRGSALLWLASRWPELGRTNGSADWEPDYLRASGAERIAAAKKLTGVQL